MRSTNLTLLSPARDKHVAFAAIQAGADAVYIGAPAYGARQAAGNSLEDLQEVVDYAHRYGVQVLVTLNTLLHEDEYADAVSLAHALYKIGVDALIIQDLHLLDFDMPPIRLHASTQCDNRTPEQVARLRDLGFRRVVLARELGISEIRDIHQAVPDIELEAFVHGALCVSYSGRCYMSEVLAGRSADRGACAQFCRMAYDLLDTNGNEVPDEQGKPIHQRYLLSLRDMDRSAFLDELIDAGVTTFKIEGRLKDAGYVTNITAYYRQKLDEIINHKTSIINYQFVPDPAKTFHRGATDYFLHGRTPHMAKWDTPKSTGEYIGEVIEAQGSTMRVRLIGGVTLHNGDGLTLGSEGFSVNGVEGNIVRTNKRLSGLMSGRQSIPLFRNLDVEFTKSLLCERRIPVEISFRETEDGFEMACRIGNRQSINRKWVYPHVPADNPARAQETIRTQLARLGDTPYIVCDPRRDIRIDTRPFFIPIGVLNTWRRELFTNHQSPGASSRQTGGAASAKKGLNNHQSSIDQSIVQSSIKERSLMTCKYCLLFEMGHCRRTNPFPKDKEPRFLRLRTGRTLRLTFDCSACQMRIDQA